MDESRKLAQPQRVPPAAERAAEPVTAGGHSRRWLLAVGAAGVVLVLALVGLAVALIGGGSTPEDDVRAAIGDYTSALREGDLERLRSGTCGSLHEFYRDLPAEQFSNVHQQSVEQGNIPVVASVDAIKITDGTALALATVYTEADPGNRSERTFDLEETEQGWKVCDRPAESE